MCKCYFLKDKLYEKIVSLLFGVTFLFISQTFSQDFNLGANFVSRYVWRGLDVASTPSLQPTVEYNNSGFTVGLWGAYTLSNATSTSDEIDLYFGYTLETESGAFGLLLLIITFQIVVLG